MNTFEKHTRDLTVKEIKALRKIRDSNANTLKNRIGLSFFLISTLLGTASAYIADWTRYGVVTFIFGTIAVICFGIVVFGPYEIWKTRTDAKEKVKQIDAVLEQGIIEVYTVAANRIAMAREDGGNLFIVEVSKNRILYLWNNNFDLKSPFPCLNFEIYTKEFQALIKRPINPTSEKIKPFVISKKNKMKLYEEIGPEHLDVHGNDFDELIKPDNGK